MIAVVAGEADTEAAQLVELWEEHGAVLVRPADLSAEGWVVPLPGGGGSFVAGERRRPTADLRAVLVRLPALLGPDLHRVEPDDRAYAAAEMTAFLAHWLTSLACPVVNRPSPTFLMGPAWSLEQWLAVAAASGVDTVGLTRDRASRPGPLPRRWVTVVGGRVVGDGAPVAPLEALARAAGVDLVSFGFVGDQGRERMAAVSLAPSVLDPSVRAALLARLLGPVP